MVEGNNNDASERGSLPLLKEAGIPFEELTVSELNRRWPQISFENVEWAIYERESGYLLARASAQAVVEQFLAEGGEYRQQAVAAHDSGERPVENPDTIGRHSISSRPIRLRLWTMARKKCSAEL